jgi:predicted CXXCH cytochrome family protein
MRRLIFLVAGLAVWMFAGAVPASADNGPHVTGAGVVADTCAGCHRAHTAQAAGLLKQPQGSLCYTCHGSGAPGSNTDVVNGVGYAPQGALRGGGFSYALIGTSSPSGLKSEGVIPVRSTGEAVTSTHSIDASDQMAWGNGAISATANYGKVIPLRCGNCHDPHGNGAYRILRDIPKEAVPTSHGVPEGTPVPIPDATTKAYTTDNYWRADDVNAPGFAENVSAWCSTCHTRYLSSSPKTNSGDAVFTYRHTSDKTSAGAGQRNCVQCHVSHGSNANMGARSASVAFPDGTAAGADSRLLRVDSRGVCQLCHAK